MNINTWFLMKNICFGFVFWAVASLFCLSLAEGKDLSFSWERHAQDVDGYELLEGSGTNIVKEVPGRDTVSVTYTVADDAGCHAFSLVAYRDVTDGQGGTERIRSPAGAFDVWCQPVQSISVPASFTVTITPVQ